MTDRQLSKFTRVELRDVWSNEASDFTPWLSSEANLAILSEALEMELEVEATERLVGPFRADILCRDLQEDSWVLIENQLAQTDHRHLGQLLTYASGLDAVTIVWIAAKFTDEHRSTLDWLNKITDQKFRFFGVEVELWRIDNSSPAPRFNIVSKPNDWSHAVADAAKSLESGELSETRSMQLRYWEAFQPVLAATPGPLQGKKKKPQPQGHMTYPIGRKEFLLGAVMIRPNSEIRAELYIRGPYAKSLFGALEADRKEIEAAFGEPLEWEDLPSGNDCRIAVYLRGVSPHDEADWPWQHDWLARQMNRLHQAFADRIRNLEIAS